MTSKQKEFITEVDLLQLPEDNLLDKLLYLSYIVL